MLPSSCHVTTLIFAICFLKVGNRQERLLEWAKRTLAEAVGLRTDFPGRVHVWQVEQLEERCNAFFDDLRREHGVGSGCRYDPQLGRNSHTRIFALRASEEAVK